MTHLADNLARLEEQIVAACRRAKRRREEIELMAVSKAFPAESIVEAAQLGLMLFGENRVQEFAAKAAELTELRVPQARGPQRQVHVAGVETSIPRPEEAAPIRVHLIGHLQSNKSTRAAELFDGIDSVDSLRLAERLNDAAARLNKRLPILIEVKLSPEETKAGLDPESPESAALLERPPDLGHLQVRGLMTIAPWGIEEHLTRACFSALRTRRDRWAKAHSRLAFDTLSMGMSGDFALAIEEGATRIRIGTALFGKRMPQPPEPNEEPA